MSAKIIINSDDHITCPYCDTQFQLRDGIASHLIEKHETDFLKQLEESKSGLEEQIRKELERSLVKDKESQIEELTQQLQDSSEAAKRLAQRIEREKQKAAELAIENMKLESDELKHSIAMQKEQIADFRNREMQLRKEKASIEESRKNLELEVARKLDEEKKSIQESLEESFKLREAEYNKKLSDAVKANEEMKRKLAQGSQQLQGEVLELELESLLATEYPLDEVEAVKTGARGADIIQTVKMRSGTECGKVIWETKRTENWSNNWISKLKTDMQSVNGNIGVIVTEVFPAEEKGSMVIRDDIWLVKPSLVKSLANALRMQLLEVQRQKVISTGREQHIEAVYDYICSPQFLQRVKAVVDHQRVMKEELEKERNAMTRIWNKREKQIDGITNQMMSMAGELQGLADDGMPLLDQIGALD
ncbi:DUF2130 domain-containing protein [Alteromonas sp. P256]|uniref:DUF2130 domain-containing protein n=1 Tax=Alteromonas sp. P256 TaxID=3117399 RepID=UPI002FE18FAE